MILDHLNNAYLYFGMHPLFKKAFEYLSSNDFSKIDNGTYELEGKDLISIVNSYDTEPAVKRFWEGHRKYIDIQLVFSGIENMGHAPIQEAKVLEAYHPEHDFTKYVALGSEHTVPAKYFTIFYPTDVHKPNLISGESTFVKKVVMKVKLPEPLITLTFASNNAHKLEEIRHKLADTPFEILSLHESGLSEELPEHGDTLAANSLQKTLTVYNKLGLNCFADDSGLEVEALKGEPGVYSARYAGVNASYEDNVSKLLATMKGETNRKARFRTVISLVLDGSESSFEGVVDGRITENPQGTKGFGYDPVFVPDGYDQTFAEMAPDLKNKISHRGLAVEKLVRFLKEHVVN